MGDPVGSDGHCLLAVSVAWLQRAIVRKVRTVWPCSAQGHLAVGLSVG